MERCTASTCFLTIVSSGVSYVFLQPWSGNERAEAGDELFTLFAVYCDHMVIHYSGESCPIPGASAHLSKRADHPHRSQLPAQFIPRCNQLAITRHDYSACACMELLLSRNSFQVIRPVA